MARGLRRYGFETRYTLDLRLQVRVDARWYVITDALDYEWFVRERVAA